MRDSSVNHLDSRVYSSFFAFSFHLFELFSSALMVTDLAVASVSHPSSYRNFRSPTEPTGREFRDLQIAETDALPHLREVRDLCVVRAHAKENKNKNTMMVPTPNNKTEKEKKNDPQKGATQ